MPRQVTKKDALAVLRRSVRQILKIRTEVQAAIGRPAESRLLELLDLQKALSKVTDDVGRAIDRLEKCLGLPVQIESAGDAPAEVHGVGG